VWRWVRLGSIPNIKWSLGWVQFPPRHFEEKRMKKFIPLVYLCMFIGCSEEHYVHSLTPHLLFDRQPTTIDSEKYTRHDWPTRERYNEYVRDYYRRYHSHHRCHNHYHHRHSWYFRIGLWYRSADTY